MSSMDASKTESTPETVSSQSVSSDADVTTETETDGHTLPEVPTELSVDVIFEVLKNERRRRVIQYLRENEEPADLGSVAEYIAALENDKDQKLITYAERKRVYVGLYQCHLPKMDDMGVVNFNRARGRIEMTDRTEDLVPYMEGPVSRRPWHQYYGASVIGGFVLYLGALGNVLPGVLTVPVAFAVMLLALTICTATHYKAESETAIPFQSQS